MSITRARQRAVAGARTVAPDRGRARGVLPGPRGIRVVDDGAAAAAPPREARHPRRARARARALAELPARARAALDAAAARWEFTPREAALLRAAARGLDGPAAARALGCTPDTVKSHARGVLARAGARSLLDAVRLALLAALAEEGGAPC